VRRFRIPPTRRYTLLHSHPTAFLPLLPRLRCPTGSLRMTAQHRRLDTFRCAAFQRAPSSLQLLAGLLVALLSTDGAAAKKAPMSEAPPLPKQRTRRSGAFIQTQRSLLVEAAKFDEAASAEAAASKDKGAASPAASRRENTGSSIAAAVSLTPVSLTLAEKTPATPPLKGTPGAPKVGEVLIQTQRSMTVESTTLDLSLFGERAGSGLSFARPEPAGGSSRWCSAAEASCAADIAARRSRGKGVSGGASGVLLQGKSERSPLADDDGKRLEDPFDSLEDGFDPIGASSAPAPVMAAKVKPVSGEASSPPISMAFLLEVAVGALAAKFLLLAQASFSRGDGGGSTKAKACGVGAEPANVGSTDCAGAASAGVCGIVDATAMKEDSWGCTDLHAAAGGSLPDEVRTLLERGADVNAREAWEETPLHFAARAGCAQVCELLLARDADIDAVNLDGQTPLLVAAHAGKEEACELLLSRGAGAGGVADDELPLVLSAALARRVITEAPPPVAVAASVEEAPASLLEEEEEAEEEEVAAGLEETEGGEVAASAEEEQCRH